jgi:outer membrane protein OmpA-like peptidoglycan-associated protein
LPDKASTPKTDPDKIQENRRVEIYSDDFRITEPVFIENINRTANPAVARFKTSYESEAGLTDWEIVAYQNTPDDGDAFRINGKNNPPVQTDWILENDQLLIPKYEKPVKYQLSVTDKKGNHFTTDIKQFDVDIITVEEKRINKIDDYEIEKCSLILFDFDKYDISGKNKQIMDNIRKKIKPESIIEIKGYTDRTGDDAYNQTLSEQRANSAKQDLGRNDAVQAV